MNTTVTGLFDQYDDAAMAVDVLESAGIPSENITIVGHRGADKDESGAAEGAGGGAGIGAAVGGVGGLLTGLGLMAIPGVGPVVAAGWLASTAAGAVAGAVVGGAAGGIIGALTAEGVSEDDAHVYAEGVRRGGTLVSAHVDDVMVGKARAILAEAGSVNITRRRSEYEAAGWTRFDESAAPMTEEQLRETRHPRG
jgi:hypothetical protein